jgi:hypothetical protein
MSTKKVLVFEGEEHELHPSPLEVLREIASTIYDCGACGGSGLEPNDPMSACGDCGGTGLHAIVSDPESVRIAVAELEETV